MFCKKCGKQLKDGTKFCQYCGEKIILPKVSAQTGQLEVQISANGVNDLELCKKSKFKVKQISCIVAGIVVLVIVGLWCFIWQRFSLRLTANDEVAEFSIDSSEKKSQESEFFRDEGDIVPLEPVEEQVDPEAVEKLEKERLEEEEVSQYFLPTSNSEYLNVSDLEGFSQDDCRLARNELYARHGRRFNDPNLQAYFDAFDWYEGIVEPDDFDESVMNEYEIANRDLIVQYEKDMGYR